MNLLACLESILFISSRSVTIKKLTATFAVSEAEIEKNLKMLEDRLEQGEGLQLIRIDDAVRLGTNPGCAEVVQGFLREEVVGELTRPQLEALTIISYRGPLTKPEIEIIRGVNCSLILRNLLMRGLIEEKEDRARLQSVYSVSFEFLRFLGIKKPSELPEYDVLRGHAVLDQLLVGVPS